MKSFLVVIFLFFQVNLYCQEGFEICIIPVDYQYVISGEIGQSEIEMHYKMENNIISGYYFYKKYSQNINILGYKKDSIITIYEFDDEINKTAKFVGVVKPDSSFDGNWIEINNKRKASFRLIGSFVPFEDYNGYLRIKKVDKLKLYNLDSIGGKLFSLKVLDWVLKNNNYFMVLRLDGYEGSSSNPYGPCGAGISQIVISMQLDNKCNIIAKSYFQISSCFNHIDTPNEDGEWIDKRYLKFSGSNDFKNFIITYDRNEPENGLSIEYFNKK